MDKSQYRPVVTSFGKKTSKGISFVNINDRVEITAPEKVCAEITDILHLCNGYRSWESIREKVGGKPKHFYEIVAILKTRQLVLDSREFYKYFHEYSRFPLTAAHNWNPKKLKQLKKANVAEKYKGKVIKLENKETLLTEIISHRKSTRSFSNKPLSLGQISGVVNTMYSKSKGKTVPSAGGIYPITLYVLILRQIDSVPPGLYCYNSHNQSLVKVNEEFNRQLVITILGTSMMENASAVVCVAGDFTSTTYKYANRGYRYLLLEAGHIAQNAYLYCAENNIGVTEYGGFNDKELASLLGLNYPDQSVLITLILGAPDTKSVFKEPYADEESMLKHSLYGDDKPVSRISSTMFHYGSYTMPFYAASAQYRRYETKTGLGAKTFSAFGLGQSLPEAKVKALAEAFERYASSVYHFDKRCAETKLDAPVFNMDLSQSNEYKRRMGLVERKQDDIVTWKKGYKALSGEKVYVSSDQIFYPLHEKDTGHKLSYKSNSSGVATHHDYNKAVENALLELIERDALAVTWHTKRIPTKIPYDILSEDCKLRIDALAKLGRKVTFLNLTLDSIPVVLCIIMGDQYPLTTTGCAANTHMTNAIMKSFNEAEFILHSWRKNKRKKKLETEIRSCTDHGDLYSNTKIADNPNTSWIIKGKTVKPNEHCNISINEVIKKFDPVVVDLTPTNNKVNLRVVRVLSEHLIPFSFGYNSEHSGHSRLSVLQLKWRWSEVAFPHLLA